jgi:hypothetical protein
MNIFILNDTSIGHAGSWQTMQNLYYLLKDHIILGKHILNSTTIDNTVWDAADTVICNGEGTMHHDQPSCRFLMEALKRAQKEKKKTLLINSVWQHIDEYYSDVIQKLDFVSVREPLSAENMIRFSHREPKIFLDLTANIQPSFSNSKQIQQYAIGCSGASCHFANYFSTLKYPKINLDNKYNFYTNIDELHSYKAYITGQHHGVYMAALARTPFIAVPSNTHKIEGLIKWSNIPIHVCLTEDEITNSIKNIDTEIEKYIQFFAWFASAPRLTEIIL